MNVQVPASMVSHRLQQQPKQSISVVTGADVRPFDVFCGRDTRVYKQQGNILFRGLVRQHSRAYQKTRKRAAKRFIVTRIIAAIEAHGGRFLQQQLRPCCNSDKNTDNAEFMVVPEYQAYLKVSHALRSSIGTVHPDDVKRNIVEQSSPSAASSATSQKGKVFTTFTTQLPTTAARQSGHLGRCPKPAALLKRSLTSTSSTKQAKNKPEPSAHQDRPIVEPEAAAALRQAVVVSNFMRLPSQVVAPAATRPVVVPLRAPMVVSSDRFLQGTFPVPQPGNLSPQGLAPLQLTGLPLQQQPQPQPQPQVVYLQQPSPVFTQRQQVYLTPQPNMQAPSTGSLHQIHLPQQQAIVIMVPNHQQTGPLHLRSNELQRG